MTRYLATVAMMLIALPIYAQTYKCKNPGGTTVFQQTPCAEIGDLRENTEQTQQSIEPQCASLIASETEYFQCAVDPVRWAPHGFNVLKRSGKRCSGTCLADVC